MRKAIITACVAGAIGALSIATPALAGFSGRYVVARVEVDDMLKMRAGPGTGYKVILGLPNGTGVYVYKCIETGGTRWCKVALQQARGMTGFVSWAYLRKN
ncbi:MULTISPECIES: SH3 domain-containing protein [Roseobacteraceae]|uniref:Bacterial SH3 domain protein n=1 Tax=Pseudosulfitobacter pseudonitzschiae TaxID=1402135 RepID=A0A221JXQ5_9RHOB|nr:MULTISPECIES: SH3 domain-containing protein [Roseobacteraceae]ASM71519.1 bacterial SH3 domain protein [Pseudosulfitobacter pseudonitzschiae]